MNAQVSRKIISDPDLQGATTALQRAAIRARELAARTGTPCYVKREWHIAGVVTGKEAVLPLHSSVA